MIQVFVALTVGTLLGAGFGWIQDRARRCNEQLQMEGKLNSGWAVIPGSGARAAYLLIALVLVQFLCPILFLNGTQWWVSAGVVAGYGWLLFCQLRHRRAHGL